MRTVVIEAEFDQQRNLPAMLGVLSRGAGDPCYRRTGEFTWLSGLSPDGGFTVRLHPVGERVMATFWGDGAQWGVAHLDGLLGGSDDPSGFRPQHPVVERQWQRYGRTVRVPRSLLTWQVAVAAVLEQRVTGVQARGAWRGLVTEHGSPAPGPAPDGMRVSPAPSEVLRVPSWDWRRYGVDAQRLTTIREVAARAHLLARAEGLSAAEGRELLTAIPGVGPWTAAEISSRAFGDADAVSVGDYHLARNVTYALTGRTDGTDDDMVALLEVYAGHRFRVVRMVELARAAPARRGPRMRLPGPRGA